jgi:hypothetical protein
MPRSITMSDASDVARQASADVEAWLRRRPDTLDVRNVEDDPEFQRMDVDLVWTTRRRTYKIEVKGDRWHETGNFFFETLSNKEKGTPGCFMYTQADFLFYYFVVPRVLYIMPVPAARAWFTANLDRFEERETTTPVGEDHYTTVGRLVPIQDLVREVRPMKQEQL